MNLIFVTSACSRKTYEKIFNMRKKKIIDPSQRFFEQLIRGAYYSPKSTDKEIRVTSVSLKPVSASTSDTYLYKKETETEDGLEYIYPGFLNGKITRYITSFFSTAVIVFKCLSKIKNKKETVLICDPLCVQASTAARYVSKLFRIRSIAIVTDIPNYATDMKGRKENKILYKLRHLYEGLAMKDIVNYDAYINLTESMNEIINKENKPSIVIEGSIDFENKLRPFVLNGTDVKTVVYAGGIYEKYGVKRFVNAFIKANISNTQLQIYGDGTYVNELSEISEKHNNVMYMGCVLNKELPQIELQATLLVNPRFSDEEYTKYSFPSKTLEYMSSGTPVLSTRLKGIPKEYDNYLYWFEDESEDGMAEKLKEILSKDICELNEFGETAKDFAFKEKSNITQGAKIIDFAKSIYSVG